MDSTLGLIKRLWDRDFRHCDLHGGNILATVELVNVASNYFKVLLEKGRGISPVDLKVNKLRVMEADEIQVTIGLCDDRA